MPAFVDPASGQRYENVPDADVARAASEFGLVPAEQFDAEQRSGGVNLQPVGEETARQAEKLVGLIPGVGSRAKQLGLTEYEPGEANLYDAGARERRAVNPIATGIGAALPAVAAGIALPGAGAAGLAAGLGVDAASGYAQAATDAELENRDVTGMDVLRSAGLNAAFTLGFAGLGYAARAALRGPGTVLEKSAEAAKDVAGRRAAAAEGADLVDAAADPAVRDGLMDRISTRAADAVDVAHGRVTDLRPPKVANNPNDQRAAIETLSDAFSKSDPAMSARLAEAMKGTGAQRIKGLRAIRDELASGGETEFSTAVDGVLDRPDLWGSAALRDSLDIDAVLASRPGAGAEPQALIDYATALRKVRGGELAGHADQIEQLAERQLELNAATALGGSKTAAPKGIDYQAAMRSMSPDEAWRLTKDGADEGMRKLEAQSVSDAFQRVDDVLKDDVAMSVKRADFVQGAEKWSAPQVAKQDAWVEGMRNQANLLGAEMRSAADRGYRVGGFGAQTADLIDRSMQRIVDSDPVTRNFEVDQLKRGLDGIAKRLAATGPAIDEASKIWGSQRVLEVSDALRKGLEDAEMFGRNANLQTETNAAWKRLIDPYSRVQKRIADFLGREFGVVGQAGVQRRFDPDAVERMMQSGGKNFRDDLRASISALDEMMVARQQNGLSHLENLPGARRDLERIHDGFAMGDVLNIAKAKAKAPLGLQVAQRAAGALGGGIPGALGGAAAAPLIERGAAAALEAMPLFKPGSETAFTNVLRKHIGLGRAEQQALLGDAAFAERLPQSLQKQLMAAGEASGNRAVELATQAASAAKHDRELTARAMVNPEAAKRMQKVMRKKYSPAIERARERAGQSGMVDLARNVTKPQTIAKTAENMGLTQSELMGFISQNRIKTGARGLVVPAELHAHPKFQEYLDKRAIERYTENSAFTVNRMLRERGVDKPWSYSGASAPEKRYYEGLKGIALRAAEVMRRAPQQPNPIFRGSAMPRKELDQWIANGVVRDKSFQSFSTDENVAQRFISSENYEGQFAENGTQRVIIRAPNGGYAHGGPEAEVMFPPDTELQIQNVTKEGDTTILDVTADAPKTATAFTDLPKSNVFGRASERGYVDLAGVAKSPLGVGTAVAAGLGARAALAPDPETTTPLQRFTDEHESPVDAFVARRKQLADFARNPESVIDLLTEEMGDVGTHSPKLEREMTEQAFKVVSYLQENMPGRRTVSAVYPEGTPPSRAEVRTFALKWEAATNPAGVLADARMGRAERVQFDALKQLWPREYDGLRAAVTQELGTGQATPLTRQRMSLLFGFGSEVDPALGPRTRAIVNAARAAQDAQKPPPSSSGGATSAKKLPSTAGLTPGGMGALQLGQQLQF